MRQSLRIIEQCLNKMPAGEYKVGGKLFFPNDKNVLNLFIG